MSQGPGFAARNAYSNKLPDRSQGTFQSNTGPPQVTFGQSAPAFGRQTQPPQASQQVYAPYQQFGAGLGPRQAAEKESNAINDLSDEQKDELNETFSLFDLDQDRHLDFHELRVALRALGFNPHKNEVLQIMLSNGVPKPTSQRANAGRNPTPYHPSQLLIPQNAYMRIAAQKMLDRDPREEVERAFYLFDTDRKDHISLEDLRRVTRELGETGLEEQELMTMIEEFDYEGIGGVSKDAFFGICLQ